MKWLLVTAPVLLVGAGLALMILAPRTTFEDAQVGGPTDALAAALSATVTCPGEISWPTIVLPGTGNEPAGGPEDGAGVFLTSGVLSGLEPSPAGLRLTIAAGPAQEIEAELVNPACATGNTALRPLLESAWSSWTRPCTGCEWTAREGSLITVGTVDALAGGEQMRAIVAITFDGCAEQPPAAAGGTTAGGGEPAGTAGPPADSTPLPGGIQDHEPTAEAEAGTSTAEAATPVPGTPPDPASAGTTPAPGTAAPGTTATSVVCGTVPAATPTEPASGEPTQPVLTPAVPTPTPGSGSSGETLTIESYTARVARGDEASVTVLWRPGAQCEIKYRTPSGTVSRAAGLSPVVLDSAGRGGWTWNVSARTSPGTGSVTVTCGSQEVSAAIEIV